MPGYRPSWNQVMHVRLSFAVLLAVCVSRAANAVDLSVKVNDQYGADVQGAVITLDDGRPASAPAGGTTGVMDQSGLAFVPQVLAVPAGSRVEFPNSDEVRHHVYSFSAAKRFELKLYSKQSSPAVMFDRPGLVTLGCNIHDWMRGYVYVVDEPYFAVTDESGSAVFDVPAGKYSLVTRHPRQERAVVQDVQVQGTGNAVILVTIDIHTRGELPVQAEPAGAFHGY